MKPLLKNFVIIVLIFLSISAIFALFYRPPEERKIISLAQLSQEINEENVEKIIVRGDEVQIFYKDQTIAVSRKEPEISLLESLEIYEVNKEKLTKVNILVEEKKEPLAWILPVLMFLFPLLLFLVFFLFIFRRAKEGVMQAFTFSKSKAKLFGAGGYPKERITFKDVAGLKEAKQELMEVVDFLKNPKKFLTIGAKIPRGVLLIGSPGTGKTLLARAVATEAGVPFFSISGSEFIELFVGVGSGRVRDLFNTAKKVGKSIIFIDELDAIGRIRGTGIGGGHDEREQTLNQILVEMDGFERESATLVFAASVSGDTPVLIKQNNKYKLLPISEAIDPYYQKGEEKIEKFIEGLEVLGFEKELKRDNFNIYFQNSAFKKVRSVFRHKVKEIYEIKYIGGRIKVTGSHSLFTRTKQGIIKKKLVSEIKPGDILVDLPYKVNQTINKREIRAHNFNSKFNLELSVWQPLFERFETVNFAYQHALAHTGAISQTQLGKQLGFSQRTIGRWQQEIGGPRVLSRNYYQHKNILPEKVKVTPELMRLFGYYVAEGYIRKEIDFCLNKNETEKIEDIKNLMKQIFNSRPSRERFITSEAINIIYYCKPLADFFAYHCGKGAKNKHIPQFLFEAPKEYFIEFLRGYAAGDGYFNNRGGLELTSVSRQLILELNWLSKMHGFKSYVTQFITKKGRRIANGKLLPATKTYRLMFGKTQNPLRPSDGMVNVKRAIVQSVKRLPYNGYVYDFCGCENEAFFGGISPVLLHNTNRPDVLDPALLRPGRFDRRIILNLPDINDREEILKIHCRGKPLALNVKLKEVAERTPGFSGADLANLVNEAAILAARRNKQQIFQEEFLESIEKVLLGPERKSHILSKKEKRIAAFHETGHALVSALTPGAEPVRKISIIARGMAAGYTLKMPTEERKIKTKSEFLAEIAVLLGGYCAEKLKFNEITTGASNDLSQASELARKLVKEYGMSSLGPVSWGEKEELVFLGKRVSEERNYSEKTAGQIDKEVNKFIKNAQGQAMKIITKNKELLDRIAEILIKKESIEKQEFEDLIKERKTQIIKKKKKKPLKIKTIEVK